ncbi:MAG: hypothetical protein FJ086_12810 [Deltaproteobacteria bacterium]|nr:hypothetical protein [Deltaproteobacteria bacterium]
MIRLLVLLCLAAAFNGAHGAPRALVPLSPAVPSGRGPAVLLVPGLGFGREIYDFHGQGLAPHLASRGWDVWVFEPAPGANFAELVGRELPAAVGAVREVRGGPVVMVVQGHGGALALAAAGHELSGQVAGIVAFNTPLEWELPNPVLGGVLERGGDLGSLAGGEGRAELQLLYAHGATLRPDVAAHFSAEGLRDLGRPLAREWLEALQRGAPVLPGPSFRERIARVDVPVLQVLALRDVVAHPEYASALRERAPRARVTVRELDRFQGCAEDYTHLSVLLGGHAPKDVFPHVVAWLESLR